MRLIDKVSPEQQKQLLPFGQKQFLLTIAFCLTVYIGLMCFALAKHIPSILAEGLPLSFMFSLVVFGVIIPASMGHYNGALRKSALTDLRTEDMSSLETSTIAPTNRIGFQYLVTGQVRDTFEVVSGRLKGKLVCFHPANSSELTGYVMECSMKQHQYYVFIPKTWLSL